MHGCAFFGNYFGEYSGCLYLLQDNVFGWPALSGASKYGHIDVVKFLLANGAIINASDKDGDTALMMAAMQGHILIVELLLSNGANAGDKVRRKK
jgi:ankyrin repeat protein